MITAEKNIVKFKAKDGREVTIRPAQASDAEHITTAVREIIEAGEFIQKDEPRTIQEEQNFIAEVEQNNHMYVVAEVEGEVLGIARVLRGEIKMKRHTGLFRTWLISKAQGMGIGKQFMNYTLNWCIENNLHKLSLTVFASNEVAYQLYKKVGFEQEGIMKEQAYFHNEYVDEIYMSIFFS
ncbi:GNAT family N-acetyltransferase [Priestia filamentosa]|uniref:GNAT family acetyltransferase n=1 Tax=Priestia filamentosa TaxID=1402861 RepID=A0A1X7G4G7_9BACI|nr:GNAT family protein [Priestia filamentosa]AKO92083.1 GNAT family acetyltransferase [Priestia filamentosa]MDT3762089.1 GNAT family protein [Priestia filamentosa]OXS65930.1 GNAT family N-acetyltransferase [Priestia filamentosa]RJS64632.1 N-acetyltransferase [Priestia filamentosa]WCM17176.1 GNAT family protein [Priestia filamentosa]